MISSKLSFVHCHRNPVTVIPRNPAGERDQADALSSFLCAHGNVRHAVRAGTGGACYVFSLLDHLIRSSVARKATSNLAKIMTHRIISSFAILANLIFKSFNISLSARNDRISMRYLHALIN